MARWRTAPALVLEDVQTGDGRVMANGSIEWADLPLPLAWLRDGDQHISLTEVGPQIGTIDLIRRDADGIIYAEGDIDENNPDGAEPVRRMSDGTAPLGNRFPISVDPDNWEVEIILTDVGEAEDILLVASGSGPITAGAIRAAVVAALRAAAGDPDPGEDGGEGGEVLFQDSVDEILERYTRLRIRGATLCSVAAFDQAAIELVSEPAATASAEPAPDDVVAAASAVVAQSANALAIPARPPAEWFAMAEPAIDDELMVEQVDGTWAVPFHIGDDGQVFGHIARRNQGHRGYTRHTPPPRSAVDYREFHVGQVVCEDGSHVATGSLVVGCDHAPLSATLLAARDYYANSGLGWADGRAVDGEHGIWFCGALRPGLTDADLRVLRALTPSGDWRGSGGNLEMISVLAVNTPGFPVAREAMAAAAGVPLVADALAQPELCIADGAVTSLVAAGMVTRCSECAERERERRRLTAALGATDDVIAALQDVRRTLTRLDHRTRHLEPDAEAAIAARVHATS